MGVNELPRAPAIYEAKVKWVLKELYDDPARATARGRLGWRYC